MGCRAENRSSHRRSFRVRNDLPQWKNTDRPVIRSRSCNILAASSGRRGECEWPVTNQFEGTGDVLGLQLTRGIINTVLAVAKVAFAHEFPQQMKANTPLLVTFPSDPTFREFRFSGHIRELGNCGEVHLSRLPTDFGDVGIAFLIASRSIRSVDKNRQR
jgi:hypothetical protein